MSTDARARSAENTIPDVPFEAVTVTDGLEYPWSIEFLPGGDFLITEKPGNLLRVSADGKTKTDLEGLPDNLVAQGQGGLLDVALHPGFANNKLIYFSYSGRDMGGVNTEVARAVLNGNRLENLETIFKAYPHVRGSIHFGSRLVFDNDGYLFISLGERGQRERAQDTSNHLGTVIRLNDDGTVPADNPFINTPGARPEIFSYGHRNVQGLALHPQTGIVWAHEHGPQGGDEINLLEKGANYGWPEITYGIDYDDSVISTKTHADGMKQPLLYWDPSIAPCGMTFYQGDKFPDWNGDIFVGALVQQHLRHVVLDETRNVIAQRKYLTDMNERIRDVATGPDGYIYVITDSHDARLIRLQPAE